MNFVSLDHHFRHDSSEGNKDVDQVQGYEAKENVKSDHVPLSDALRSPGAMMIVLLDADIAVTAMVSSPFYS